MQSDVNADVNTALESLDDMADIRETRDIAEAHEANGAVSANGLSDMSHPIDIERIKRAVTEIILAVGEDPNREGLRETPRRVADMYAEVFSGLRQDPAEVLQVGFNEGYQELVLVKDIPFYSMCEHHFLPFH